MLAPALPALQRRVEVTDVVASALYAGYSFGTMVGFVIGGVAVRRLGVRNVLLLAMAAHVVADLTIALSTGALAVAAARVGQGTASGALWIAVVAAAVAAPEPQRSKRVGRLVSIYWLGGVVGPVMGLLGGVTRPFLVHAGVAVVVAVAVALFVAGGVGQRLDWGGLETLRRRGVVFASVWIALLAMTQGIWYGSFSLRFAAVFDQSGLVLVYGLMGLGASAAAAVAAAAYRWGGPSRTVRVGALVAGAPMVLVALTDVPALWLIAVTIAGVVFGFAESGALNVLTRTVPTSLLAALVLYSQAWAAGYLLGPLVGSSFATLAGWAAPGTFVIVAAALLLKLHAPADPSEAVPAHSRTRGAP